MAEIRQFSFWWKNFILIGRLCNQILSKREYFYPQHYPSLQNCSKKIFTNLNFPLTLGKKESKQTFSFRRSLSWGMKVSWFLSSDAMKKSYLNGALEKNRLARRRCQEFYGQAVCLRTDLDSRVVFHQFTKWRHCYSVMELLALSGNF